MQINSIQLSCEFLKELKFINFTLHDLIANKYFGLTQGTCEQYKATNLELIKNF